jgi:hypothetical protein
MRERFFFHAVGHTKYDAAHKTIICHGGDIERDGDEGGKEDIDERE